MALSVMGPSVVPITGITPSFVIYDPADANANHTKFIVSTGGAVHVPVLMIGDPSIYNVDLGWFDGITQPTLVVADDDADSYVGLGYSADDTAVVRMVLNSGTVRQHVIPDSASSTFALLGGGQTFSAAGLAAGFKNTTDSASVQVIIVEGDRATMADGDAAYITLRLSDSAGNQDEQARITWSATTVADGATQDGDLVLSALVNNSLTEFLRLDGSASELAVNQTLVPKTDDGFALGTTSLQWKDLFLASGGVLAWNNTDRITHTANTLTLSGVATLVAPATLTLFNTGSTTVNAFGAATTMAFGAATSATTWTGQSIDFTGANSTNNTTLTVTNTSNAAVASHAIVNISVGGTTSTGNPQLRLIVPGSTSWYVGVDNLNTQDLLMIGTGSAVGTAALLTLNNTFSTTNPNVLMSIPNTNASSAFTATALRVALGTWTMTSQNQRLTLWDAVKITAATLAQSAGAVIVDKYAALSVIGATAGASVTLTHSSAIRTLTSGAAVNVSGIYYETQTAGTTGNYQSLYAVSTGASPALIDHVGVNAKDFGVDDTRLYFQAESGGYIALGGNSLYFEQAATIATAATTLTLTPATDVHITEAHGLVIGHTAQITVGEALPELQVLGTAIDTDSSILVALSSATNAADAGIKFLKSGNATIGSFTTVATGEYLGNITWYADDGVDYTTEAATLRVVVNGTVATNRIPSDLVTSLDPGGSDDAIREAMRLKGDLSLVLGTGEAGIIAATGGVYRVPDATTGGAGNVAGADLTLAAGLGTGTGDVGQIIFQLPVVAGAGDFIQTLATRLTLDMASSATELTMSAPQAFAISAVSATDSAFRLTDGTTALIDIDTRIAVTNQTFVFAPPASLTLPAADANVRYRLLSTAASTVTLAGTTTITPLSSMLDIGALTLNQSGGAVTVNKAAGISAVGVTAGASVTLTHSSALRALTGGAAANVSGIFLEAQTGGTVGNYQILMANGGTEPVSLADHVGIAAVDIAGADATLAIATEVAVAVDADETKFSNKLAVRINGATYYIMLTAS